MGNEFGHPEWIDFPRGDSYDNSTGAFVSGTPQNALLLDSSHLLAVLQHDMTSLVLPTTMIMLQLQQHSPGVLDVIIIMTCRIYRM